MYSCGTEYYLPNFISQIVDGFGSVLGWCSTPLCNSIQNTQLDLNSVLAQINIFVNFTRTLSNTLTKNNSPVYKNSFQCSSFDSLLNIERSLNCTNTNYCQLKAVSINITKIILKSS